MGLLDFGGSDNQSKGGLLGDLDPTSKAMLAMAIMNKFNNNRGAESGFGDIFGLMMQQQQLQRQEQMDKLQVEKFGLDKQEFDERKKLYNSQSQEAQRKAQMAEQQQQRLNSMAQGVIDYKAPAAEMRPIIPEYNEMPLMGGESLKIPTTNYLNNMFSAADEASKSQPKGAFISDPGVRQQAAELIRSGDTQLVKQAYDLLQQGGAFTLGAGDKRFAGPGNLIAENPYTPKYGEPKAVIGPDGKYKLVQFDGEGNAKESNNYQPIPKSGTVLRDANGNVIFEQGGWGQAASPTNATTNDLQKDTISSLNTLNNLDQVAKDYKSSYLTYAGQARGWTANKMGKVFGQSGDKEFLQGKTKFQTGVQQMFNQYRKDITGAAASVQELDRLKQSMLNEDMSPEEFEAAYSQFRNIIESSLKLKQQYMKQGLPLDQVGKAIDSNLFSPRDKSRNTKGSFGQSSNQSESNIGSNDPLGLR